MVVLEPMQPGVSVGWQWRAVVVVGLLGVAACGGPRPASDAAEAGSRGAAGSAEAASEAPGGDGSGALAPRTEWVDIERPAVRLLSPPGWDRTIKDDGAMFWSPDREAVLSFSTFSTTEEVTARVDAVLRVMEFGQPKWTEDGWTEVGPAKLPTQYHEGLGTFRGPNGYIWTGSVDLGKSWQVLFVYAVSDKGNPSHKDAVLAAIRSLQQR